MLTGKQEKFVRLVALEGLSFSEAYRQSYQASNMLPATVKHEASLLADNPNVTASIEALKATQYAQDADLRQKALDSLLGILESEPAEAPRHSDRVNAADKLLKATGAYREPEDTKVTQTVTNVTVVLSNQGHQVTETIDTTGSLVDDEVGV